MPFTSERLATLAEVVLRPLMPEDEGAARALIVSQFARTRYEARVLEHLESALGFEDPEYMAVLAELPAGTVVGLILFGAVAGARAVTKLHAMVGVDRTTTEALLHALYDVSERAGERLIVCEIPDESVFGAALEGLTRTGFHEEGRIADFVSDGIAMRLLVRRLERSA